MSQINCIIIRGSDIHLLQTHYNKLIVWIDKNFLKLGKQNKKNSKNPGTKTKITIRNKKINNYLDAGYIIIDFNDRIIVNNQDAFCINDLSSEVKKALIRWDYFDFLR